MKRKLILATKSRGRRKVLEATGLANLFEFRESHVNEVKLDDPVETTRLNAVNKAKDVASRLEEGIVIGVDTVVYFNGEILGKPRSLEEAFKMLKTLSGNWHEVYTSIAVLDVKTGKSRVVTEKTRVKMALLSDIEIKKYVETREPLGKAGGYAIQGFASLFIERIEGCYYNVVGLPLNRLREVLLDFGVNLLLFNEYSEK